MKTIYINNITKNDVKAKILRITVNNKSLFPAGQKGIPQKYDLIAEINNNQYTISYTIGSQDATSRSGVLRMGNDIYENILHIKAGDSLKISKLPNHHHYKIENEK